MQIQEEKGTFFRPRWELKNKGSPHPARRWCHTTTINGGYLYVMGGRLSESAKSREFVYRVNCETFSSEPILILDNAMMRQSHSSGLVGDNMYILFGINKAGKVLNDCLQLKIESNGLVCRKKSQNPQIEGRESHMSLVLDNRYILIYGGIDGKQKLISEFYIFDLESENWKKIDQVEGDIQGKVGGTLINIKNQIYLFGGEISDQNQYSNQIYKIQIANYKDPKPNIQPSIQVTKLNVIGPKPVPRSQFASVAFKDRYLIVLGGQGPNKEGSQPAKLLNDVWAFDTEKNTWEEIVTQNPNLFKPRSSFTANIYKDNLIVFGGLVAFKDFRSSDQIYVLNLSTQVEKKPVCTFCKSSFKAIQKQQVQIQKARAVITHSMFSTSFSTILAIAKSIQNPYIALSTLLHSFDYFQVQKCAISLCPDKLTISLQSTTLTDSQWHHILGGYDFMPLIQQRDERIKMALKSEIRHNLVNYLSYNIKNCCLRLGNELLISWVNESQQLQIFLMNKFGLFHTMNVNLEQKCAASQRSIILQHLKEQNINISDLYNSQLTLCVSSLKNKSSVEKQIIFIKEQNDILRNGQSFRDYLKLAFARNLSFEIVLINSIGNQIIKNEPLKLGGFDKDKWPQNNLFPDLFEEVFTYEKQGSSQGFSQMLVYQNNKLMHKKQIQKITGLMFQFHLTNKIQPNLTFSDVLATDKLIKAIKTVISQLNLDNINGYKRKKSLEREMKIDYIEEGQAQNDNYVPKKAVKTNKHESEDFRQIEQKINQFNSI